MRRSPFLPLGDFIYPCAVCRLLSPFSSAPPSALMMLTLLLFAAQLRRFASSFLFSSSSSRLNTFQICFSEILSARQLQLTRRLGTAGGFQGPSDALSAGIPHIPGTSHLAVCLSV